MVVLNKKIPRNLIRGIYNPGTTYFPRQLPAKYNQRFSLYYRIRNGNGCDPEAIRTKKFLRSFEIDPRFNPG